MAAEIITARSKIKNKLDIASADVTYDAILLECIEQAIPRLSPWIQYQVAEDVSQSLAVDADKFTLTAGQDLQRLYGRTASTDVWRELDLWRQHRNTVYITEPVDSTTSLKILSQRPFTYSDADLELLATDYPSAMLPLYNFAMSEFYTYLTGNKRKFNDYIQSRGVSTLDEMKDLVTFYEERAIKILENEVSAEGQ